MCFMHKYTYTFHKCVRIREKDIAQKVIKNAIGKERKCRAFLFFFLVKLSFIL